MDEAKLIHKLKLLEAIFADTDKEGERVAAGLARDRILARLAQVEREDPPVEFRFAVPDPWKQRLLMTLLRRYGIRPYRYHGQRRATVMARVSRRFVDETLWPEFQQFSQTLEEYLSEVTDRVLKTVLGEDIAEAETVTQGELLLS